MRGGTEQRALGGVKTVDVKIKPGTYNMDADDLVRKITKNSRAELCNILLARAAELTRILAICKNTICFN